MDAVRYGSPPQVRGKHHTIYCRKRQRRITPAGAGKTMRILSAQLVKSDHPRRCGENCGSDNQRHAFGGSPPQVRGKPSKKLSSISSVRITPAGAGKTARCTYDTNLNRDHPRRCGENIFSFPNSVKQIGSPPQVRGKLLPVEYLLNFVRITPAGAGKTEKLVSAPCRCQDHPRRCGENHQSVKAANSLQGSPPQVRGKRIKRTNVI